MKRLMHEHKVRLVTRNKQLCGSCGEKLASVIMLEEPNAYGIGDPEDWKLTGWCTGCWQQLQREPDMQPNFWS